MTPAFGLNAHRLQLSVSVSILAETGADQVPRTKTRQLLNIHHTDSRLGVRECMCGSEEVACNRTDATQSAIPSFLPSILRDGQSSVCLESGRSFPVSASQSRSVIMTVNVSNWFM